MKRALIELVCESCGIILRTGENNVNVALTYAEVRGWNITLDLCRGCCKAFNAAISEQIEGDGDDTGSEEEADN